jgi:hypothetical protein
MAFQINNNIIKFGGVFLIIYNNKNNIDDSSIVYNNSRQPFWTLGPHSQIKRARHYTKLI